MSSFQTKFLNYQKTIVTSTQLCRYYFTASTLSIDWELWVTCYTQINELIITYYLRHCCGNPWIRSNLIRYVYHKTAAVTFLRTNPHLSRRRMMQNAVTACGHFGSVLAKSLTCMISKPKVLSPNCKHCAFAFFWGNAAWTVSFGTSFVARRVLHSLLHVLPALRLRQQQQGWAEHGSSHLRVHVSEHEPPHLSARAGMSTVFTSSGQKNIASNWW